MATRETVLLAAVLQPYEIFLAVESLPYLITRILLLV